MFAAPETASRGLLTAALAATAHLAPSPVEPSIRGSLTAHSLPHASGLTARVSAYPRAILAGPHSA